MSGAVDLETEAARFFCLGGGGFFDVDDLADLLDFEAVDKAGGREAGVNAGASASNLPSWLG